MAVISYQLSVISYQLSVISYQLSVISFFLSSPHFPTSLLPHFQAVLTSNLDRSMTYQFTDYCSLMLIKALKFAR
ncbi:MAG: hypothetical protein EWV81_19630 [Microcystis aeruginosa Ma_SC_T_19800800_S464]|jgi:hypothetical protein|uniref:Uncharacterized protein n=1 Tax=Microcystis aeruginosa Ma_SC_T_19800800_S464 TaxID=2486257 RepID=A0A552DHT1_MICAE|nr:MAG: hypothetical protein EWV81_19630 [Microcystis aeruginosa Ma_SC_T_19800800_S464]